MTTTNPRAGLIFSMTGNNGQAFAPSKSAFDYMNYYKEFSLWGAQAQQKYMCAECLAVASFRTLLIGSLPFIALIAIFLAGIAAPAKQFVEIDREVVRNTRFLGENGLISGIAGNTEFDINNARGPGLPSLSSFFSSPSGTATAGVATAATAVGGRNAAVPWYSNQPQLETSCSVYAASACQGKWAKPVAGQGPIPGVGGITPLTRFRSEMCGAVCERNGLVGGSCKCTRAVAR